VRLRPALVPSLLVLVALVPLRGFLSLTRIFYVRDLSGYFWPHHLWLRTTLAAGHLPLWDPNPALGRPMSPEAALQFFFLPTLPFRLLLPDVLAFNLWVALPFPLAALGLHAFARRHLSTGAAALGGLLFALAGPVLSTSSTPNLAWGAALVPWMLWSVDRLAEGITARRAAVAALVSGCAVLAGEPGITAAAAGMAVVWIGWGRKPHEGPRRGLLLAAAIAAPLLGLLLAAVQVFPLIEATGRSIRGAGLLRDSWPLHPLRLFETVLPGIFGNYLGVPAELGPWLAPLNSGREPYLFSVYLGPVTLMLAAVGLADRAAGRWRFFWGTVVALAVLASFGDHTPFYPAIQSVLPWLKAFRYPTKFMVLAALGLALLAARGWDRIGATHDGRRSAALLGVTLGLAGVSIFVVGHAWPGVLHDLLRSLAEWQRLPNPAYGAAFLSPLLSAGALRLLLLVTGGLACLWVASSSQPAAPLARRALAWLAVCDLLAAGSLMNPTMDASRLREPAWASATRRHPDDRVFVAQDLLGSREPDEDVPPPPVFPVDRSVVLIKALRGALVPEFPSVWGVKEALSSDVSGLETRDYLTLLEEYARSDREARTLFLQRAGTRYYLLPRPPSPGARAVLTLPGLTPLALYEGPAPAPRLSLVSRGLVEADASAPLRWLFDPGFDPAQAVVVEREPAPAGVPGPGGSGSAALLDEEPTRIAIAAQVPEGGAYLLLLDRYDPHWRVAVDGADAPLLRADGLFRAVRLAPGAHAVVFSYRYRAFWLGAAVSALTAGALLGASWRRGSAGN
jgi:hypothetical protein